jgi:hypothetical protein
MFRKYMHIERSVNLENPHRRRTFARRDAAAAALYKM